MGLRRSPFLIMEQSEFKEAVLFATGKQMGIDYGFDLGTHSPFTKLIGLHSCGRFTGYKFWRRFTDGRIVHIDIQPKYKDRTTQNLLDYLITDKLNSNIFDPEIAAIYETNLSGEYSDNTEYPMYKEVVSEFSKYMIKELVSNSDKGNREGDKGWLKMSKKTQLSELYYHVGKLQGAIKDGNTDLIKEHCADIANGALMVFDIYSPLK